MRTLLLCAAALAATGCATISTDLDPQGSPKYRGVRSTGTNFAAGNRFDAKTAPATKTLGDKEDIDRLFRPGGSNRQPGQS